MKATAQKDAHYAASDTTKKAPLSVLDRPINRASKKQVSLSAYAYLFSELVQYTQTKVASITEFEERKRVNKKTRGCSLWEVGYPVGVRTLEWLSFREKKMMKKTKELTRETKIVGVLGFLLVHVWPALFGAPAAAGARVERSTERDDEYMIRFDGDEAVVVSKFVSLPQGLREGGLTTAAFVAGVVNGVLDAAEFRAKVSAHFVNAKTVLLIKFEPDVIAREREASRSHRGAAAC